MVGEVAAVEPVLPVVRRPHQPPVGLVERLRGRVLAPGQRAEDLLALLHEVASGGARALDAEVEVAGQAQLEALALDDDLVVVVVGILPATTVAAVVEHRLAHERELDLAVDAADSAQQDVVGVVIGRRPPVGVRALPGMVPGADQQDVADDDPAAAGPPARLEDHRSRQVAARGRHVHTGGPEPERAGVAVEQRSEHARRVHPGQAHPLDAPARRDESRRLAVGQEAVVRYRRERAPREALRRQLLDHPLGSQQREPTAVCGPAVALSRATRRGKISCASSASCARGSRCRSSGRSARRSRSPAWASRRRRRRSSPG